MKRLDGRTAVITGGATGIGLASAQRFIDEGAFVYIFGRRQEVLDAAMSTLGDSARAVAGSVDRPDDLARLFDTVKAERGSLDIVFANAGTGSFASLGDITAEQYDQTFDVNVKGLILTATTALPLMGEGGSIILTGSSASEMGMAQFSVYSASKAAVRALARCWAQDLRGTGIRVNVLSPGPTVTDLSVSAMGEENFRALGEGTPIGRVAEPSEIAAVAAFLASDDASFVTGAEIFADGGIAQV